MPISLRIPESREKLLRRYAEKTGKTKTAVILEAIDEKLGLKISRREIIRNFSGWMSEEDTRDLKRAVEDFDTIHDGDWE